MWLHIPGLSFPSARAQECLRKESRRRLPRKVVGLWVTLSGKPVRRQLWWIGWRTRAWMTRLYGTISRRSLAASTAIRWISSLADIRASHSVPPARDLAGTIRDIYGRASLKSLRRSSQGSASLRTLLDTFPWGSEKSGRTWETWVSGLRLDCSQRRKSGRATGGNGCLSWPSASVSSGDYQKQVDGSIQPKLQGAAKNWATPAAWDEQGTHGGGQGRSLRTDAANWPTPASRDVKSGHASRETLDRNSRPLNEIAKAWPTPAGTEGDKAPKYHKRGNPHLRTLASSLQAPKIPDGQKSSGTIRRLNPQFVCWLMGWPPNYLSLIASGLPATAWSRWRRLLRSSLLRLISRT